MKAVAFFLAAFLGVGSFIGQCALAAKQALSTPTIECVASTDSTITIMFCAGDSGAPAGFSIQWMTLSDFTNGTKYNKPGQWPSATQTGPAADAGVLRKASFGGNGTDSPYSLAPGQCVDVVIGDLDTNDPGVSYNSNTLTCGTTYVFRAFAHSTTSKLKSDFSDTEYCSTTPCP
jgi:hypothetical protein